jgi:hypothetical protein
LIWSILLALQLPEYLLSSPTLIRPQRNPYMLSSSIKTWLLLPSNIQEANHFVLARTVHGEIPHALPFLLLFS